MTRRFGCIEAGGTKIVAGVVDEARTILARTRIPTTTPAETIAATIAALRDHGPLSAIGIASFGPVMLDPADPRWGFITATTKPGWSDTDMAGPFARAFAVRVGFDTDVNGAGIAEARWGAAAGDESAVYVTIGTGVGGGAIIKGVPIHGLGHPEMGHIRLARHPDDLGFPGVCPFHGDCLEGLASGPAINKRWGASLSDLAADHPAHAIIAYYIGQLANDLRAMLAPHRIILGGGVMATAGLLDRVRAAANRLGGGYFTGDMAAIIVPPALGDDAGLLGALALAIDAAG
jgi:fructokinase